MVGDDGVGGIIDKKYDSGLGYPLSRSIMEYLHEDDAGVPDGRTAE